MPYCPRCGVETDPSVKTCPLCTTAIPTFTDLGPGEPAWPDSRDSALGNHPGKVFLSPEARRLRAYLASVAVLFSAAVAVVASNLYTDQALTWGLYPLASLTLVAAGLAALLAWPRRPLVWGTSWLVFLLVYLAGIDWLDDRSLGWFPTLGVTIPVLTFTCILVGVATTRFSRRQGYHLLAVVAALILVELVGIDAAVSFSTTGAVELSWSWITSLVLTPLTCLFLLLHWVLHRTPDLGRIFHF